MAQINVYDKSTGRIKSYLSYYSDEQVSGIEDVDTGAYIGDYTSDTTYFVNGEPTDRPDNGISIDVTSIDADGIDTATLTGVTSGSEIFINDSLVGIADGSDIEVTFDLAGTYKVKILLFPYLDYEVTINAN